METGRMDGNCGNASVSLYSNMGRTGIWCDAAAEADAAKPINRQKKRIQPIGDRTVAADQLTSEFKKRVSEPKQRDIL